MGGRAPSLDRYGDEFAWWLLDAAPDATLVVAGDGDIVFANGQAGELFGYELDQLLGLTVEDLLPESFRRSHRAHRARFRAEPANREMGSGLELHAVRSDGSEIPVEVSLNPLVLGTDLHVIAAVRDISTRLRAEAELEASRDALEAAGRALAVTEERERIARDLHDTVIQRLFAESLSLQATLGRLDDHEETRQRIEAAVDSLDSTITEIRAAIFSLHTARMATSTVGLRAELLEVVETTTATLDFRPVVRFDGSVEMIDDRTAQQMIPVLREGLTNVVKHARATGVRIALEVGDEIVLTIEDDGAGIPVDPDSGCGLHNLSHRARTLGGRLQLDRSGSGTLLRWAVPLRRGSASGN